MMGKLFVLMLLLSALAVSSCGDSPAETAEPPSGTEAELCTDKATGATLSYEEAVQIAQDSECVEQGQLKETRFCNADTGTWWIDLDIDKAGCMPACVVNVNDKTAEINWRCTGALPPVETETAAEPTPAPVSVPEPASARDAALAYVREQHSMAWPEQGPPPELRWTEEELTPEGLVGSRTFRYTAQGEREIDAWVVTVSFPLVDPAATVFQIAVTNEPIGFEWEGEVDAAGQVTELSVTTGPPGEPVVAWYGFVAGLPAGAQFDDYLVVLPEGTGEVGLEGADAEIAAQIAALRDKEEPGKNAHFWGTLNCPAIDYGGCQLVVSRVRPDGPGPFFDADGIRGWEGVIYSGPPGPRSGGDDYLALTGDWNVQYGIWSPVPETASQLESLRDTGTVVRVWGELVAGVPDWNGTQIHVHRVEVVEVASGAVPPAPDWPEAEDGMVTYVNEDFQYQISVPPAATVTETGVQGFPTEELPEGMTADEYLAQLREQLSEKLCVHIEYGLGYLTISSPVNEAFRYATCGRTGVGTGETLPKTEELTIGEKAYTAQGFEFIGNFAPCDPEEDTLECHNETLVVVLDDGTRIEYGARPEPTATYQDYLMKGKEMLYEVLASYKELSSQ